MNRLAAAIRARLAGIDAWVVGIGGGVAVGKTTVANMLAEAFDARVLSTDGFLFDNDELARRDILMRKGFPESYDTAAIVSVFTQMRAGVSIEMPVYSHETYDILDRTETIHPGRIIVEGVTALQEPMRAFLDVAVYVDAATTDIRGWFVDRFARWSRDAQPGTFYAGFSDLDDATVRSIAEMTWDGINGPNLAQHIDPTRDSADIVVRKNANHDIVDVVER